MILSKKSSYPTPKLKIILRKGPSVLFCGTNPFAQIAAIQIKQVHINVGFFHLIFNPGVKILRFFTLFGVIRNLVIARSVIGNSVAPSLISF